MMARRLLLACALLVAAEGQAWARSPGRPPARPAACVLSVLHRMGQALAIVPVAIVTPFTNTVTTNLNYQTGTAGAVTIRGVPFNSYAIGGTRFAVERSKADYAY